MRLELFFKSQSDIVPAINFLSTTPNNFKAFNIPNKNIKDPLLEVIDIINRQDPSVDIACHYSLKYNNFRNPDDAFINFESFLSQAKSAGANKILLVSGGGDKKKVNSLTCLQFMKSKFQNRKAVGVELGVAFNPFFRTVGERSVESTRLMQKLETGLVSHIWLQFGSDLNLLREALESLHDPEGKFNIRSKRIQVIGSIMLPSKVMLARMKFRPWNGVFLSDEYLNNLSIAQSTTRAIWSLYQEFNIEPLIETSIKTPADVVSLRDMMTSANGVTGSNNYKDETRQESAAEVALTVSSDLSFDQLVEKKERKDNSCSTIFTEEAPVPEKRKRKRK